jgi:hypothetical protein
MTFLILALVSIGIMLIIIDNRKTKTYNDITNRALEYQRKEYLKSLKDGER